MAMINENYFRGNEAYDLQLFQKFNDECLHLDWEASRNNHHYDVSATSVVGRDFVIELKRRNIALTKAGTFSGATFTADTIYIEDYKLADMMLDYTVDGDEPLYINFLANGVVLVCNLSKLTVKPRKFENLNIESKGYEALQRTNRYGIYLTDFAVFKDGKLVKKQGESWKR